jgi:hypothetical protein
MLLGRAGGGKFVCLCCRVRGLLGFELLGGGLGLVRVVIWSWKWVCWHCGGLVLLRGRGVELFEDSAGGMLYGGSGLFVS